MTGHRLKSLFRQTPMEIHQGACKANSIPGKTKMECEKTEFQPRSGRVAFKIEYKENDKFAYKSSSSNAFMTLKVSL